MRTGVLIFRRGRARGWRTWWCWGAVAGLTLSSVSSLYMYKFIITVVYFIMLVMSLCLSHLFIVNLVNSLHFLRLYCMLISSLGSYQGWCLRSYQGWCLGKEECLVQILLKHSPLDVEVPALQLTLPPAEDLQMATVVGQFDVELMSLGLVVPVDSVHLLRHVEGELVAGQEPQARPDDQPCFTHVLCHLYNTIIIPFMHVCS